jgi:ACS family hexuronate transporter-like MFS transporter
MFSILGRRNFWGIALPRFLTDPTWGMLSFWVPLYLTTVRHFDLKHIAMYAWLPFLAADLGCIFGPSVVLFLQKRGLDLIDARRGAFTLGALMMIGVAFTGFVQNPLVAVALISLAGFAHQTLSVTMITMATDLFPRNEVGTVAGMAGTCANLGILIFTFELGQHIDQMGYNPVFIMLAVLDLVAAAVAWMVIRKPVQA